MSSRSDILGSIRKHLPPAMELPALDGNWIEYDDPVAQFRQVLEGVGGECHEVEALSDISALLGELTDEGKTVVSCVAGVQDHRFDLSTIRDPHELDMVDLAILPGEIAVAENAAIWVTDQQVPHRVLFFLAQHLALVVPRSGIVSNMHAAYERIDVAQRAFGAFISGPSKTADIEQSLVKGAHGARTLKVFLVDKLTSESSSDA